MPHAALARRSGCVQQEPAENVCGGYPQEGRGNARVSVRTGASRQQKIRARVAEGSKGRAHRICKVVPNIACVIQKAIAVIISLYVQRIDISFR